MLHIGNQYLVFTNYIIIFSHINADTIFQRWSITKNNFAIIESFHCVASKHVFHQQKSIVSQCASNPCEYCCQ